MARKALLDNLDMETGQGAKPAKVVPMVKSDTIEKPVKTSLYLPPKALHKLKEMALAKNCKVHDLMIEGIDHVLTGEGFPSVKEYTDK